MIVVAIIGILAAIAIPAFVKYLKQTKTSEAGLNLKTLADGASAYYQSEHLDTEGNPTNLQFPSSDWTSGNSGVTDPSSVPAGTKSVISETDWTDPAWRGTKFKISKPVYYRYTYTPTNDTTSAAADSFVSYAEGDLDDDGTTSKFNVNGTADASGELKVTPVFLSDINNELE